MRKATLIIKLCLFIIIIKSQSNIIPNPDFELGNYQLNQSSPCSRVGNSLNKVINNWKVSLKGKNPDTRWVQIDDCNLGGNQQITPILCNINSGNWSTINPSNKVIWLKRIYGNATFCLNINKDHIGVALENGATFISGKKYLIRYKFLPKVAQDIAIGNCNAEKINTNLMLFLSKNGPLSWEKNDNPPLQQLSSSGIVKQNIYPTNNSSPCDWIVVEKSFTPNNGHFTSLIFRIETGAVLLDDVEIFEECESNYMVQNKTYYSGSYPANPPYVTGGTFKEQSGFNLTAGNAIGKPNTPNGDVVIESLSHINYTAPNSIKLKAGFKAKHFSEFKAVIAPCPNSVNKSAEDYSNDTISAWRLFADYESDIEIFNNSSSVSIYPNPAQNKLNFTISDELFSDLAAIELHDVLGRKLAYTPSKEIAINELNNGYYTISFIFYSKNKVTKSVIKAGN